MSSLRDWLKFSRIHTASLTIPGVLLAAYLADPLQAWWRFVLFGIVALTSHAAGFQVNNLLDLHWDRVDPSKKTHPLVTGAIPERAAWFQTFLLANTSFAVAAYLSSTWVSLLCFFGFVAFGTAYNYWAKKSLTGPILISLSFACLPAWAWYASGGHYTSILGYLVAFCFTLMLGQIAISGWTKELAQRGEVNLLRNLGATIQDSATPGHYVYYFPRRVKALALALRGGLIVLPFAFVIRTLTPATLLTIAAFALLTMAFVVSSGYQKRQNKVFFMGIAEILGYWYLIVSLNAVLPFWVVSALIVAPLFWYFALNKIMWGSAAQPAV